MEMNYDEKTLRQLEEELNVTIVPGTEVMTDVGSHHFVKSSAASDRVLVPQPSDDPHDPLVRLLQCRREMLDVIARDGEADWDLELETVLEILMPCVRDRRDVRAGHGPFIGGPNVRSAFAVDS
ncbi:MAG: hypothetical protein Q9195_001853 [Heterodermia aff. obscurata]